MVAMNETVARMRRALASDDPEMDMFAARLTAILLDRLPEGEALQLERMFACTAQAGEELGPDATVQEILARSREIAARPN